MGRLPRYVANTTSAELPDYTLVLSSGTPLLEHHVANKKYVDDNTKLYEHRIKIEKHGEQGSDAVVFRMYLTLYRRTGEVITAPKDIYNQVSTAAFHILSLEDADDGYRVPVEWYMDSSGNLSIGYYNDGGTLSQLNYNNGDYTITDTVTEI